MANTASYLSTVVEPGTTNTEGPCTVEYWDILGDASGTTMAITPKYMTRVVAGSAGNAGFAVSGNTITFTFSANVPAVHILARLIGKP